MTSALSGERSYRCFYTPTDRFKVPVACDSGVLPYVQVRAHDAEGAQRAAHHATGCPVSSVERIEHVEA